MSARAGASSLFSSLESSALRYCQTEAAAVGSCKHCQRGQRMVCAALAGDSLACRSHHEEQFGGATEAMMTTILRARASGLGAFETASSMVWWAAY